MSNYVLQDFNKVNLYNLEVNVDYFDEKQKQENGSLISVRVGGSHQFVSQDRYDKILQWSGYVRGRLSDVENGFLGLAYNLYEMRCRGFHLGDFYKFVEKQFGICPSTCRKLIAVVVSFCDKSGSIKKGFEGFNYSQLENMLPLSYEERLVIKPTMTVAQIKSFKAKKKLEQQSKDIQVADIRQVSKLMPIKAKQRLCKMCNSSTAVDGDDKCSACVSILASRDNRQTEQVVQVNQSNQVADIRHLDDGQAKDALFNFFNRVKVRLPDYDDDDCYNALINFFNSENAVDVVVDFIKNGVF